MKVYFCASLAGGRDDKEVVTFLVHFIESCGYSVLDNHVAAEVPNVKHAENLGMSVSELTPRLTMEHDFECVEKADCLIAELSSKGSYGVGGEIHHCWIRPRLGLKPIPMLFLYKKGSRPNSAFVVGRKKKGVWMRQYRSVAEAKRLIMMFFKRFNLVS